MRKVVDMLVGLAVLVLLVASGFRFFTANMGFGLGYSDVTPLFLWRVAMALLALAAVLLLRQIRDKASPTSQTP
jgi:hypothetical protein